MARSDTEQAARSDAADAARSPSARIAPNRAAIRTAAPAMLATGLFLAALNLRPAIASISPLLDVIRAQVHLSRTVAGLLTTIPTLCIGLGAFLVPPLAARLGLERALTYSLVLIGLATMARAWAADATLLFATTLVAGAGIAAGQTLMPGLVRKHFSEHSMIVTALYSVGITLGAAIPAALVAPLRGATGSWELALAFWAVLAFAAVAVLAPIARRSPPGARGGIVRLPWRSMRAWQIALLFGGESGLYFVIVTWLAPLYEDHGWSATTAGLLLTLLSVSQAATSLLLTWRARQVRDRRPLLLGSLGLLTIGMAAVAITPYSLPILWAVVLGVGNGIVFPAMLVLPVDYATDPQAAARLAAMGFGFGYLLASLGPVLAGGLRDLTGTYEAAFGVYSVVCVLLMVLCTRFVPVAPERP